MSSPIVLTTIVLRDFNGDKEILKHRYADGSLFYIRTRDNHPVFQDKINRYIVKSLRLSFPALAGLIDFHGKDNATTIKLIAAVNRSIYKDVSIFKEINVYVRNAETNCDTRLE